MRAAEQPSVQTALHRAADQAAGLRRLIAERDAVMLALSGAEPASFAPLGLDLAAASEREGRRVLVLDLTRGALARRMQEKGSGLEPRPFFRMRYELMHVIDAHKRLDEVVLAGPRDVPLLPAARAVRALASAWRGRSRFADFLERAGGAPQLVLALAPAAELEPLARLAAFATLVALGPEVGANLKDCYAALKRAHALGAAAPRLVYVGGLDAHAARRAHSRLSETSRAFLGGEPELVGRLVAGGTPEPRDPAPERGFPSLRVDQLARAVARWPLPPISR